MATVFEQVSKISNVFTGVSVACQSTELSAPYTFRNSIVKSVGAAGGINTHTGGRAPMAPRTVKLSLIHVYNQLLPPAKQVPGLVESYSSVMALFDAVLGSGYEVLLTLTDANGNLWYNTAVVESVDKVERVADSAAMVTLPVTFTFFVPYWAAQYKAGVNRYDQNPPLYFDTPGLTYDADPDQFALSGTSTSHVVANTGVGGGTIPDYTAGVTLTAGATAIPGPIQVINYSVLAFNGSPVYLQYNAPIAAGESVTFDGVNLECLSSLIGAAAYANLSVPYANGQDSWFLIAPGNNTVAVTTGVGTLSGAAIVNYKPFRQ